MIADKNLTILVVDDDDVDVMGVTRAFEKAEIEHNLVVANDGIDALDKLTDGKSVTKPYMILLDLNMPRMNGIEFLEKARSIPEIKDSIVFVLTTSKDQADRKKAYQYNPAGYIVKDLVPGGFINAAKLLERYSAIVEFP